MGKKSPAYVPPDPVDYAAEEKKREKETTDMALEIENTKKDLLDRKKKGAGSLLLTGGEGVQDEANIGVKSLLGSSVKKGKV